MTQTILAEIKNKLISKRVLLQVSYTLNLNPNGVKDGETSNLFDRVANHDSVTTAVKVTNKTINAIVVIIYGITVISVVIVNSVRVVITSEERVKKEVTINAIKSSVEMTKMDVKNIVVVKISTLGLL